MSTELIRLSVSSKLAQQNLIKMMNKIVIAFFALVAVANCGIVAPYASTYNAHTINHAVATPFIAAPAARFVSPFAPSAKIVSSPYVSSPYIASPYAYSGFPYSSPYSYPSYSPYSSNYFQY